MKKLIPFILGRYLNTMAHIAPAAAGRHGFRLFCYPFRVPIKKYQKEWLDTAEKRTIDVSGVPVQVYRWGTGRKHVLLLHGWQSHTFRWKNYIEQFSEQYSVWSVDAPGHGLSSGNFLTVPVYSEVVERVAALTGPLHAIISHSLGAFTTLYTLNRLPEFPAEKVVLLAPPGEATQFIEFYQSTLSLSDKSIRLVQNHFARVIEAPVTFFSAPSFASTVRQPGLIIHDEEDEDTPAKHSVNIHKAWKGSELLITKGLGHNLKSPIVLKKVIGFLDEAPVTTSRNLQKQS